MSGVSAGSATKADIALERLHRQRISERAPGRPVDVIAWLGAVQAQEFAAAKWAVSLRSSGEPAERDIDRAFDAGRILRTHVLRPTWHFVVASDIRWMLELTAPRVHQALASARRAFELDDRLCIRATSVFEQALGDGRSLTRAELNANLARAGIAVKGIRLALLTIYAELEGIICSGPRRGKDQTYALLAERAPKTKRLPRDEALAELTRRYFRSHGPATARDFSWWSGLTMADARRGLEMNGAKSCAVDGLTYWTIDARVPRPRRRALSPGESVHLLPVFDEYLVAYRDRIAVPVASGSSTSLPMKHTVIIDGQIAGAWKPARGVTPATATTDRRLAAAGQRALDAALARYGRFLGPPKGGPHEQRART